MRKIIIVLGLVFLTIGTVSACGGLFCQTTPVSQQGERIIFTMNGDGTITAYVQINYTGDAPNFSWVVPVPSVPEIDVAEMASFNELDLLTQPVFIAPPIPACAPIPMPASVMSDNAGASGETDEEVTVLASGTAGPYAYDVITSPDPDAMFRWLRENDYRLTDDMGPLIRVYNDESMVFLAMKLQPEAGVQDIQPIVMTYESDAPMIPIRLTAVAANPNMNILTWIFADEQAYPANYEHITVEDQDIRGDFMSFGGTNYLSLLDAKIDLRQGLAMITEYAQPTGDLAQRVTDPLLLQLTQEFPYMTRLLGRMSPEEMTVDPVFLFDGQRENISNVRDLSRMKPEIFWNCEAQGQNPKFPQESGMVLGIMGAFGISAWTWRRKSTRKLKV
jgi:hypothetical protein